MKTIRQYPKGCDFCNATGFVSETGLSTSSTKTCPVCHGSGVIIVTETIEDEKE